MDENTQAEFMRERYNLLLIKIIELILTFIIETSVSNMDSLLGTLLIAFVFVKIIFDLLVLIWSVLYEKIYIQTLKDIPDRSENELISLVNSVESYLERNKGIDISKFYVNVYKFHKKITIYYASLIAKEDKKIMESRNINTDKVNINDEEK